ncbi:MAG: hypothetical protein GY711_08835 [bacterium]|nr:hypothetical protein [bacterium]
MESRAALTRALVLLVLTAAIVTAPVFLFAEGFDARSVRRVLASNGMCVALCLTLLALLRRGQRELAARILVGGSPRSTGSRCTPTSSTSCW